MHRTISPKIELLRTSIWCLLGFTTNNSPASPMRSSRLPLLLLLAASVSSATATWSFFFRDSDEDGVPDL